MQGQINWLTDSLSLTLSDSLWLSLGLPDSFWLSLTLSDSLLLSLALSYSLWLCLALSDSVWLSLALSLRICLQSPCLAHKALARLAASLLRYSTLISSDQDQDQFADLSSAFCSSYILGLDTLQIILLVKLGLSAIGYIPQSLKPSSSASDPIILEIIV